MRDFVAKISLTALFVLAIFSASAAEKVTFEANSPLTVAVGEAFRVEFALNAYPDKGTIARLLGCKCETVSDVVRQWGSHDDIRRRSRRIWLRRRTFLKYWEWLMPFMQQRRAEERAAEALRQARRREEYDSF